MEDLRDAMRIIDENSDKLSEGDYLKLCNSLKNVYRCEERKDLDNLIDFESFNLYVPGENDEFLDYFDTFYYQTSLDNEQLFLKTQMNYLESELEIHRPIRRTTKTITSDALRHYCYMNNITLTQYTPELFKNYQILHNTYISEGKFKKGLQNICKSFIRVENTYRNLARGAIMDRIEKIERWIENLEDM
jgi:hypothetical protein